MNSKSVAEMRITYDRARLADGDVAADPVEQFGRWFDEAVAANSNEANALILATADSYGVPQARTVLLKGFDERGLVIYTNYASAKAEHIDSNPSVCALFYWPSLQRQVRWTGTAEKVSAAESDDYFASRPRGSQLGAIASHQSQPIGSAEELRIRFMEMDSRYGEGELIPRPDYWGGYRIRPLRIEFWQGRENRLHDRILFTRDETDNWHISRLAP